MNLGHLSRLARELESLSQSARRAEGCARTIRCFDEPTPAQVQQLREKLEAVAFDGLAVLHEIECLGFAPPPSGGGVIETGRARAQRHG